MSDRVKQKRDARRRELLDIALSLFMEMGYEKTSIRSLATRAGGDIGLIYHYFHSKNEIYEAALAYFNEIFLEKVSHIVDAYATPFETKLDSIFNLVDTSLAAYRPMKTEGNNDIMLLLLSRTLASLVPVFEKLISSYLTQQGIELDKSNQLLVSNYMLYGFSGIIHTQGDMAMAQRYDFAKRMLYGTLAQLSEMDTFPGDNS